MQHNLTEAEKKKVNKICTRVFYRGYTKKVSKYNNRRARKLARQFDYRERLPLIKFKNEVKRTFQGGMVIADTYLEFLIEESLKYSLPEIIIPYIGILNIREIDPKGSKWVYYKDNKKHIRLDTVFDEKVMYRIFFTPYFKGSLGSLVNFKFSKKIFSTILSQIYKKELEPGVYPFYKRKKI